MTTVTVNGNQYSDNSAAGTRNLDNGGHRQWFLPLVSDVVTVSGQAQTSASAAAASAATALSAPGTSATSASSLTIGTGSKSLTIQTGKSLVVGMTVKVAITASPTNWMSGDITAYDANTGALTVDINYISGSGTASAWTVSLSAPVAVSGSGDIVTTTETQTLTNKTLTAPALTDPAITGAIIEDVFTITDGAAFEIDPGNGTIQLVTLGASRTPKATNFAAGESVTLMVDDGSAYTLTWTDATFGASGVVWVGGAAPTLATTGYTVIELWKVSSQVYGALVGSVA